ncbi:MAG: hypothetical protein IID14_05005 [Candidatus Marinimicrobia bacterium]|nr:hypothetical protein [Candidatus Neomarinimicrobiota bacterium]
MPRRLLLFLLFWLVFAVEGNRGVEGSPGGQIITSEMISSAGLTRIGEILLLVDEWTLSSTDGFTWMASPNGLAAFQSQNWIVMLDGQRFDLNSFDVKNLYMLPVTLDQIDYVEVLSVPQLHMGEFADRGLIHIHTVRPGPGVAFHGTLLLGNETGDAGPYRYTQFATANIDRSANDGSLTMEIGKNSWYLRANLAVQQYPFTDWALLNRISALTAGWPGLHMSLSPSLKIGAELLQSKHELMAGYSHSPKYFLFFKPLGREIPVKNRFPYVGVKGNFPAFRHTDIAYRLKYSTNQLDKYLNTLDLDFDWEMHNFQASIESKTTTASHQIQVGIGFDRFELVTGYPLDEGAYDLGKIYGKLSLGLFKNTQQSISMLLTISNRTVAMKGALTHDWDVNPRHRLRITFAYSQRLPEEDNSLWYWADRGYDLLNQYSIDYSMIGPIDKSAQWTADVAWKNMMSDQLTIETTGSYRSFADLYLERQSFQYNAQDCSFNPATQVYGGQGGQVLGASIAITHRSRPRLSQRLFYSYRAAITGDDVFTEVWEPIPRHKASYRLTYAPVDNFRVWAMLSHRSASVWPDYRGIDGQECTVSPGGQVTYYSTVKGATIYDLQFQKWFWHRRLIGRLLFRNIMNQNYQYHPIGASFDLSYFIQVEFLLDSQ